MVSAIAAAGMISAAATARIFEQVIRFLPVKFERCEVALRLPPVKSETPATSNFFKSTAKPRRARSFFGGSVRSHLGGGCATAQPNLSELRGFAVEVQPFR